MTVELIAIGMTLLLHILGALVLVWALLDGEKIDWRGLWPRDDDGPDGPDWSPEPPSPTGGTVLPLPLPGAEPSGVRLREPGRIGDAKPRPTRRPEHAPEHPRPRVPERS